MTQSKTENRFKVALVVSHPIQHFCPQYESFANLPGIDFKVFFASTLGYKPYYDVNFKKEIKWDNINLNGFDHEFLNGDQTLPSNADLDAPTLDENLRQFAPNVIIGYGYHQRLQRRALKWANENKIPFAYISDGELRQKRNPIKQFIKYLPIKYYFSKIDYFLTTGDSNEAFYAHYGVPLKKMTRLHFPVDVKSYNKFYENKDYLNTQIRKKHKIEDHSIVVSVVGKLVPWKSQDKIIDAMLILEEKGIYMHLFILGSGEMEESYKRKSDSLKFSKVYFNGFTQINDLPSYYAATDIYIHPSKIEPHSIAISEAIFMGCPIIVSSRSGSYGPSDDVREGINGLVFNYESAQDLADKIKFLIDNNDIRQNFSLESVRIAQANQQNAHGLGLIQLINKINLSNIGN